MYKFDWGDGDVVVVTFTHINFYEMAHASGRKLRGTSCTIRKGKPAARIEDIPEISKGFAYLHPSDNYCKATGRKISLRRALGIPDREKKKDRTEKALRRAALRYKKPDRILLAMRPIAINPPLFTPDERRRIYQAVFRLPVQP